MEIDPKMLTAQDTINRIGGKKGVRVLRAIALVTTEEAAEKGYYQVLQAVIESYYHKRYTLERLTQLCEQLFNQELITKNGPGLVLVHTQTKSGRNLCLAIARWVKTDPRWAQYLRPSKTPNILTEHGAQTVSKTKAA